MAFSIFDTGFSYIRVPDEIFPKKSINNFDLELNFAKQSFDILSVKNCEFFKSCSIFHRIIFQL